jgi:hypothetical protein
MSIKIKQHTPLGTLEFTAAEQELMGFIQVRTWLYFV